MNLKSHFPNASKSFFDLNPFFGIVKDAQANRSLQPAVAERDQAQPLGKAVPPKEESLGRVVLRFKGCFVRLKDPDNFVASLKDLIDGLRRLRIIPGDEPDKIKIICEQEKVSHFTNERIELKITYP